MSNDSDNQTTRIIQRSGPKGLPSRGEPSLPAAAAPPPVSPAPPPVARAPEPPPIAVKPKQPSLTPPLKVSPPRLAPVATPEPVKVAPDMAPPVAVTPPTPVAPVPPRAPQPAEDEPMVTGRITPVTPPPVVPVPAVSPFVAAKAARFDPVVGWVVVVKGPGRGQACELRGGRNAIGSAAGQAIRLDFGDPAIAPHGHAYLVYDDEERSFVIEDGKQKELVRLNGHLLSETRSLGDGDEIRIGATTLRFVALCGPGFDWKEAEAPVAAAKAGEGDKATAAEAGGEAEASDAPGPENEAPLP